ncbi:FG-GAP-like repeat-containing protein [Streptomyces sp. NPDC058289]|uniref:FG-GAP-like repeat-containing protein n=1 Tax=Streptomyces sp. NPDC058289 TaxID=3346425 RepID=UPI0036E4A00B
MSHIRPHTVATAVAVTLAGAAALMPAGAALAAVGTPAAAGQYTYTAQLNIGDEANSRACSAVLVNASWVMTATSCFAKTPGAAVVAGMPELKATAKIGKTTLDVINIVPHGDRDVVLAKLSAPVAGIDRVKFATTKPAVNDAVNAAGFGRTKIDWVPGKVHTAAFQVASTDSTTLALNGKGTDAICQGDAGGPLVNSKGQLVGISSRSWQSGCLGTPEAETRTDAVATPTNGLKAWVDETDRRFAVQRDLNGDGRSDAVMVYYNADSSITFYSSLSKADGGFNEFKPGYTVPVKSWDPKAMKLITGDFNGDGRTDVGMMYRNGDSSISMYTGLADASGLIQPFTSSYTIPANSLDWSAIDLYAGDANGDGRSDAVMVYHHADTSIAFYSSLSKADGGFNEYKPGYTVPAKNWDRSSMKLIAGDFNGDGRTDMGMLYRNGNTSLTMYTGLADSAGLIQPFTPGYTVPANNWDWKNIELHAGDLNGDGRSDALMTVHKPDTSITFYSSLTKADGGFNAFKAGYTVPAKNWDRASMKLIAGDYNGDGRTDMGMMYRNADSSITMYTGLADTASLIQPFTPSYKVPVKSWDWNSVQLP